MEKIVLGTDFNVLLNKDDIIRGKTLIGFTISHDGLLYQDVHDRPAYSTDKFDKYAVKVFNHIRPNDLIKIVQNMEDKERRVINGVEVIRLYN